MDKEQVIDFLFQTEFDIRYYTLYERLEAKDSIGKKPQPNKHIRKFFTAVEYFSIERFWHYERLKGSYKLNLNMSFTYGVEFIFGLRKNDNLIIGSTFPGMALQLERMRFPEFERDPRYPKLPFHTVNELEECLQFGQAFFDSIYAQLDNA